jgi:hypothetical protein
MKLLTALKSAAVLCLGGIMLAPATVSAQAPAAPAKEELVRIRDIKAILQKSPKIPAEGPTDKRWKPRDWIEIEVECDVKPSKKNTDKNMTTYSEVTFKYYVFLEGQTKEKSRILTGEVVHASVPINQTGHSSVYIHPDTILSLTGRPEGNIASVKLLGVEAQIAGETVGFKASSGTPQAPWWNAPTAPAKEPGLKRKSETPFSILWSDYHYSERGK